VDLVCGGFPCQPVSEAGQWQAQDDTRWLWPAFQNVISELQPRYALVENVPGLLDRGMGDVVGGLATLGYDAEWSIVSACVVGAPHTRERVFIVAYPASVRLERAGLTSYESTSQLAGEGLRARYGGHWATTPRPHGVAYGIPSRVDRLRAQGNAVVPQVAEHIGRLILAVDARCAA
jgi:DNA (cytosine-5)-methyltransferase 1